MGIKPKSAKKKLKIKTKRPAKAGSLADALFSATQQRVLGLLFGQSQRSYYATELINLAGAGSGAVQRELETLTRSGLVTVRAVGNQKHYQANASSPIFAELTAIAEKTFGLAEPMRAALSPFIEKIRVAFVYGSVAKREDTASSDVDLMVISDTLSYADFYSTIESVSARLNRKVNPTIYTSKELAKRVKENNPFLKRVLSQPKVWLIGDKDEFAIGQSLRSQ